MQPLSTGELESLIELMRDMHDFAMAGNWQELTRLDNERRVLLNFNSSVASPNPADHTNDSHTVTPPELLHPEKPNDSALGSHRECLISEIRLIDSQITQAVLTQRKQLLNENRGLSAQLKAKELYAQTSAFT